MVERIRLVGLPGTGKTTRLLKEVNQIISSDQYQPSDIIFCSHSNASVNEAKTRVQQEFGVQGLKFTTIHSLAQSLVSIDQSLRYLKIVDLTGDTSGNFYENRLEEFLRTLKEKYNRRSDYENQEKFKSDIRHEFTQYFRIKQIPLDNKRLTQFVEGINKLNVPSEITSLTYNNSNDPRIGGVFNDLEKNLFLGLYNLIQIIETAWCVPITKQNKSELQEIIQRVLKPNSNILPSVLVRTLLQLHELIEIFRNKAFSFNQVLFEALHNELTPTGRVLVIDEYQDIGRLQYELAELWAESMEVFIVAGDPNQSIYGFNGVSPKFLEQFNADHEIYLFRSYRVPSKVIDYAKQVYCTHWTKKMVSHRKDLGEINKINLDATIQYLLQYLDHDKIFVLTRSSELLNFMQLTFREYGIYGKLSFELRSALTVRVLYQSIIDKLQNENLKLHDVLSAIEQLYNLDQDTKVLTKNFIISKIEKFEEMHDIDTILTWNEITQFNLTNSNTYKSVVQSGNTGKEPTEVDSITRLSSINSNHLKRIRIYIKRLMRQVNQNKADLSSLEKFLMDLKEYEKKNDLSITDLLNKNKIKRWMDGIKFRNFENRLHHYHLGRFRIDQLIAGIEEILDQPSIFQDEIPDPDEYVDQVFSNNPQLLKSLTTTEMQIFENTAGIKDILAKLEALKNRIKYYTMHAAKGREADLVIVPSVQTYYEERKITDPEESRRVYFVAVTRTRERLIIIEDDRFPRKSTQYLP